MDFDEFTDEHGTEDGGEAFQLENKRLLDVHVDGSVTTKSGAMVAYTGEISFTGKSSAEGGLTGMIKEKATSEGTDVMEAEGEGHLYLADQGKTIQVLSLDADQSITVDGEDVLAFDEQVDYEISTIDSLSGASAGGLTNVYLTGPGYVAITTHGEPLVLTPPVRTDPDATVAWGGGASPGTNVDHSLSDMIGQSSGENYQLDFSGSEGFVLVQPYEESGPQ